MSDSVSSGDGKALATPIEDEDGLEVDRRELRRSTCPYCGARYDSKRERDRCVASHFEDTEDVDRKGYSDDEKWSIVDEWRENL